MHSKAVLILRERKEKRREKREEKGEKKELDFSSWYHDNDEDIALTSNTMADPIKLEGRHCLPNNKKRREREERREKRVKKRKKEERFH